MDIAGRITRRDFIRYIGALGGTAWSLNLSFLSKSLAAVNNSRSPVWIYNKYGFQDHIDYLQKGASFIRGTTDDWIEEPIRQHGNSPYTGAAIDLILSENGISYYLMSKHSGMVKIALQLDANFPNVDTLLHFDAHEDIHLDSWTRVPCTHAIQQEIYRYAENEVGYGSWINPLAYLGKFKKVVHIAKSCDFGFIPQRRRILRVVESAKEDVFKVTFDNTEERELIQGVEWVELLNPNIQELQDEIRDSSWAFSICNDYYVPNLYHVVKATPMDIAIPIRLVDVKPMVELLKRLPKPGYAAINISPHYTVSPNSLQTCKYVALALINHWA